MRYSSKHLKLYDANDVSAIQAILDAHPVLLTGGVRRGDPATWDFAQWENGSPRWLTALTLNGRGLTGTLEVSHLPALTVLSCDNNKLTALKLYELPYLSRLYCNGNHLAALDVSNLPNLTWLYCNGNRLSALDMSGCKRLTKLYCCRNRLKVLDMSALPQLAELYCGDNRLSALDVSGSARLTLLSCGGNRLTALQVSGLAELTLLSCGENRLSRLNVSALREMRYLYCGGNRLKKLDLSALALLDALDCGGANPLLLTLPGAQGLPLLPMENGCVSLSNLQNGVLTVKAVPFDGFAFERWEAPEVPAQNLLTGPFDGASGIGAVFSPETGGNYGS